MHHLITHLINHPEGKKEAIQCSSERSIWSQGTYRDQTGNPMGCRQAAAVYSSQCTWSTRVPGAQGTAPHTAAAAAASWARHSHDRATWETHICYHAPYLELPPRSLPSLAVALGSKRLNTGHSEAEEVCLSFESLQLSLYRDIFSHNQVLQ